MTLTEKAAYLKGLKDGLKLDTEKAEGKLLDAIVDMLNDVALEIADIEENASLVNDELDMIEDELDAIEEYLDDEYDEDDDDDDDDEEDDQDEDDYDFGDDAVYEITCPTCGETIEVDEETLMQGAMNCPKCNEELEFDFDEIEEDEE